MNTYLHSTAEWLAGDNEMARARAAELLSRGECVVLPTETVYGLAADARNPEALRKIFAAKGRPADHPLIVHLADRGDLSDWCCDIPDVAWLLADVFWPGPLTLLLQRREDVPAEVTGDRPTVCVRVPQHPVFLDVLKRLNTGLAAPSANPYKSLSPTTAAQVMATLGSRVAAVVDGGRCGRGIESTIVDLTDVSSGLRILRAGPVSAEEIEIATGMPVHHTDDHSVAVPGNVRAHYQPATPLQLFDIDDFPALLEDVPCLFMVWSSPAIAALRKAREQGWNGHHQVLPDDPSRYAYELYHTLYTADQQGHRRLCIERPPQTAGWRAINDRLRRAAAQ